MQSNRYMTQLIVAGLDRTGCDGIARRLRALARHAHVPLDVKVTTDAIDVQRLGKLGAVSLIFGGRTVAQEPLPDDVELEKRLVAWSASADAEFDADSE